MGRRCTYCGGLMTGADELMAQRRHASQVSSVSSGTFTFSHTEHPSRHDEASAAVSSGIPTLTLYNPSLNIRIVGINGAIIGRRQGPYQQMFEGNRYVSGVHAQLIYNPDTGWNIIDKHSSNGTKLNQRDLLPDVPMSLKSGDIVMLANINMQVSIV